MVCIGDVVRIVRLVLGMLEVVIGERIRGM